MDDDDAACRRGGGVKMAGNGWLGGNRWLETGLERLERLEQVQHQNGNQGRNQDRLRWLVLQSNSVCPPWLWEVVEASIHTVDVGIRITPRAHLLSYIAPAT
jgi:hypothetical protein